VYPRVSTGFCTILLTEFSATSVAVEHVLSHGHRLLNFTHNCMSPISFHCQLCLGSWGRCGLLWIKDLVMVCTPKKRKRISTDEESIQVVG
ncbi:hypothetical protein B0H14DRAFT_2403969, partial [Mycena olivaceomarginata]